MPAAVQYQPGFLEAGGLASPIPYGATIHVDEVGAGIAADATCVACPCSAGNLSNRAAFQPQIRSLTAQMQRVAGNAG